MYKSIYQYTTLIFFILLIPFTLQAQQSKRTALEKKMYGLWYNEEQSDINMFAINKELFVAYSNDDTPLFTAKWAVADDGNMQILVLDEYTLKDPAPSRIQWPLILNTNRLEDGILTIQGFGEDSNIRLNRDGVPQKSRNLKKTKKYIKGFWNITRSTRIGNPDKATDVKIDKDGHFITIIDDHSIEGTWDVGHYGIESHLLFLRDASDTDSEANIMIILDNNNFVVQDAKDSDKRMLFTRKGKKKAANWE